MMLRYQIDTETFIFNQFYLSNFYSKKIKLFINNHSNRHKISLILFLDILKPNNLYNFCNTDSDCSQRNVFIDSEKFLRSQSSSPFKSNFKSIIN